MENQIKKLLLNSLRSFFLRVKELLSRKYRKHKIHQRETMIIMDRISVISNMHPELSKYLNDIPEFTSNVNDSAIRLADLRKYNNRLLELLEKYEVESHKSSWFI
jgi:hypothetical protein